MSDDMIRKLGEAVQEAVTDGDREGGIVTAFVVIAEVHTPNGMTWLCGRDGTPTGDRLASWTERGMLTQRLVDMDNPVWHGDEDDDGESSNE